MSGRFTKYGFAVAVACAAGSTSVIAQTPDSTDRTVLVEGRPMHVRTIGVGTRKPGQPVVVFEAGGGQTADTWSPVFTKVAAFAPVFAYDRRGIGASAWDSVTPTPERISRNLRATLEAAGIAPPYVLVGHSLGGAYVRMYTGLFRDHVAGLVLIDPTSVTASWAQRKSRFLAGGGTEEEWKKLEVMPPFPASAPPGAVAEAQVFASWQFEGDRWKKAFADLPPFGDLPYALMLSRRPPKKSSSGDGSATPTNVMLQASAMEEEVRQGPFNLLIVSTSSGHYVHRDEPALTIETIRRIFNFAAQKRD
jgi:pimeloyl-ACP methyl ester carboxylesterase